MTEEQLVARRLIDETLEKVTNDDRTRLSEESEVQLRRMKSLQQWLEKIQRGFIGSPDHRVQHNREREQREVQQDQRRIWEDSKEPNH